MAILTRCPECGTTFRVTPAQLQARQGMVRCGRCAAVFDGFKTLSNEEESPAAEPMLPAAELDEPPPPPAPPLEAEQEPAPFADAGPEPAFKLEPVSATELAAAAPEPARETITRIEVAEEGRDFGPAPEQLTIDDQLFLDDAREKHVRRARWWAAGAALLVLVLAGQALYVYRGELAAYYPPARPWLDRACGLLQCRVALPQRPRSIAIEASDLQAIDTARPGMIQLTATVRNHAGHDVGYPALDLVLTNTREHTLARRIFLPAEYLEPGRDARAGIPAAAEVTIRLDLDAGELNPAGFRLDLQPAPAR